MDDLIAIVGVFAVVVLLALISAIIAIFGLNGLFGVMGLEYNIPYTLESVFYMWVTLLSFGRGGSDSSKK